jgi:hypothetical protein
MLALALSILDRYIQIRVPVKLRRAQSLRRPRLIARRSAASNLSRIPYFVGGSFTIPMHSNLYSRVWQCHIFLFRRSNRRASEVLSDIGKEGNARELVRKDVTDLAFRLHNFDLNFKRGPIRINELHRKKVLNHPARINGNM